MPHWKAPIGTSLARSRSDRWPGRTRIRWSVPDRVVQECRATSLSRTEDVPTRSTVSLGDLPPVQRKPKVEASFCTPGDPWADFSSSRRSCMVVLHIERKIPIISTSLPVWHMLATRSRSPTAMILIGSNQNSQSANGNNVFRGTRALLVFLSAQYRSSRNFR